MLVDVTKDRVTIKEYSPIHQGDYNVNICKFLLSDDFVGMQITACFNGIPVPLSGNMCVIPCLIEGNVVLGVYGYMEGEDGLTMMYSPKPAEFYVMQGSFCEQNEAPAKGEISEYEKLLFSFQDQIISRVRDENIVKIIIDKGINIRNLSSGIYWINGEFYVRAGDDIFKNGMLVVSKMLNYSSWFLVGNINDVTSVWYGITSERSNNECVNTAINMTSK